MKYFELYEGTSQSRDVEKPEWTKDYDIVIAGGGSSGTYCALAAAQEGKRVLLLEKGRWFGGMHVQGLINGYYFGCRGGLYTETDKQSRELSEKLFYDITDAKRMIIADILEKSGIDTAIFSMIVGLYAEGQKIIGVRACIGNEVWDIKCSMLVDATSDGHVLRQLPVTFYMGRETDHSMQPFSSVRCVYVGKGINCGGNRLFAGKIDERYDVFHEYRDNGYINQYDEEDLTANIIHSHASHLDVLAPSARFLYLAPHIGVREGNRYEGEQVLTLENVLVESKKPENILLYGLADIDKHGQDYAFDEKTYHDWYVKCNLSTCSVYIPIPVGAVVPKGWKGIITTGRCLSVDSYINAVVRMNTDCFRIGEACGLLAAMAVDCSQDPMKVSCEAIQSKLTEREFFKNDPVSPPSFWNSYRGEERRFVHWMTEIEEIKEALSTNKPAVALWSCRLLGKENIGDQVYELTKSNDDMLRNNAAIALGIMQDERSLPLLQDIVRDRKAFFFMDCRRTNQMRSVIAISLCGQMKDVGIVDELLEIIRPEEFEKPFYHEELDPRCGVMMTKELNSVYYQHFSHAVAALIRIAEAHEEYRDKITEALHEALDDESYIRRMTDRPEYNAFYKAAYNCKKFFVNHLV